MASLTLEGFFEDLSDKQVQFIRDSIVSRGFKENKVIFEAVGIAGDNFASNVRRITVKVDHGDDFVMIAKIAPSSENFRYIMNPKFLFDNETIIYVELFSKFKHLEEAANVPKEERIKFAECYGYLLEEPYEVILLEDLKESNYIMLDKSSPLESDNVKLSLKTFATFHALSYAFKISDPTTYDALKNKLVDISKVMSAREDISFFLAGIESSFLELIDNETYKICIEGSLTGLKDIDAELETAKVGNKYSIIQHGDVWSNNILFKYKEDKVSECIMIDYQMSSESNPACDILNLIFNCTRHADMIKYLNEWLDYYHEHLSKLLSYFGLKASEIYPKDQLHMDIKKFAKLVMGQSLFALALTCRNPAEASEMMDIINGSEDLKTVQETMSISKISAESADLCRNKIENLVRSCIDLGFT